MKKQKGITLIALVITIIILIILAGVAINLTLGDNGIFNKAKLAKEKYNEETIREKVELGIMELEIDEMTLGNQVTIESVLQELLEKEIFETIDKDAAVGNIGEYEVKLKYNENQKVEIEYIAKATGVRVTYKLNPETYTNGEKVGILLTVNGKVKSVTKPDNLVIYPENSTVAINYQVTENGTYKFIIESEDGSKQEKNVVVDTIDRLAPNYFTIKGLDRGTGIEIVAEATDAESDGTSVKSGIEKYEYFVKGPEDSEYIKYETNEVEVQADGTYSAYVIAYDKANNSKTSNTISVVVEKITRPVITKLSGADAYIFRNDEFQQIDYAKAKISYGKKSNYKNYYSYDDTNWIEVEGSEIELELDDLSKKTIYAKTIDTEIEETSTNSLAIYNPYATFDGYAVRYTGGVKYMNYHTTRVAYVDSSVWEKTYKIFLNEPNDYTAGDLKEFKITFYDENNTELKVYNITSTTYTYYSNFVGREGNASYPSNSSITVPKNSVKMEIYSRQEDTSGGQYWSAYELVMPYPY